MWCSARVGMRSYWLARTSVAEHAPVASALTGTACAPLWPAALAAAAAAACGVAAIAAGGGPAQTIHQQFSWSSISLHI